MKIDGSFPDGSTPEYAYKAQAALAFIRKWDGTQPELTEEDMNAAAQALGGLIEAKHIQFADFTEGHLMTYLRLAKRFEDGSAVTMSINTSLIMRAAGGHRGSVRLMEIDPRGVSHETYDYDVSPDGLTASRIDGNDDTARMQGGPVVQVRGNDPGSYSALREAYENTKLEDGMGYNNQPVGLNEIRQLAELVSEAVPVAPNRD